MLAGLIKQKYAYCSACHAECWETDVLPNMYELFLNSCVCEPFSSVIVRRGRGEVAYLHRQWVCRKGPGQIGQPSRSRSKASGWPANQRPRTNVILSGHATQTICRCTCDHTLLYIWPYAILHVAIRRCTCGHTLFYIWSYTILHMVTHHHRRVHPALCLTNHDSECAVWLHLWSTPPHSIMQ